MKRSPMKRTGQLRSRRIGRNGRQWYRDRPSQRKRSGPLPSSRRLGLGGSQEPRCTWCKKDIPPRFPSRYIDTRTGRLRAKLFCSTDCHLDWKKQEGLKVRRSAGKTCHRCGKPLLQASPSQIKKYRYCSEDCYRADRTEGAIGAVNRAAVAGRGPGWRQLAKTIRIRDGHSCRRCGQSDPSGRTLHVDHIIPFRAFATAEEANQPNNLASLCGHCHAIKTNGVEMAFKRGDFVALKGYVRSLGLTGPVAVPAGWTF